jgi:hypothetical protein
MHGRKGKLYGKGDEFLHGNFWIAREFWSVEA